MSLPDPMICVAGKEGPYFKNSDGAGAVPGTRPPRAHAKNCGRTGGRALMDDATSQSFVDAVGAGAKSRSKLAKLG
jgi:hypothetical protein